MPKPYISHRFRIGPKFNGRYPVYQKLETGEKERDDFNFSTGIKETEAYLRSQFPFCKIERPKR